MKLPEIGELNRRVKLIAVSHGPSGDSALTENRRLLAEVWAKVEVNGGASYWDSVNVDETVTHRIYVRYVPKRTTPPDLRALTDVECEGIRYRVRRTTDVNGAHRFTMMECEELGCV